MTNLSFNLIRLKLPNGIQIATILNFIESKILTWISIYRF